MRFSLTHRNPEQDYKAFIHTLARDTSITLERIRQDKARRNQRPLTWAEVLCVAGDEVHRAKITTTAEVLQVPLGKSGKVIALKSITEAATPQTLAVP